MTDPNATGQAPVVTKKKQRVELSRELSDRDAVSLEFYFGDGQTMFARSTTGSMLERAELFSRRSFRCWGCPEEPGIAEGGGWCMGCDGTGYISAEITYAHAPRCAARNKRAACSCRQPSEVNARPTAESADGGGYEPSHGALQLFGRVSRRLAVVAAYGGASLVDVLKDHHGDVGSKWGRRRQGRIFAVYARTIAGRRLIRKTLKEESVAMPPDERLHVLNELQQLQPKKWRGDLLEQAAVQARRLYGDACAAFNFSALLVRESPAEAIARALRAAERPRPVQLPTSRDRNRYDPAASRPAMALFGKGKDGFAKMKRLADEEFEKLEGSGA